MLRCDLCNEHVPDGASSWTYVTPPTAATPEAAEADWDLYYCDDPEWLVCESCHRLIDAKNERGLLVRSITTQRQQAGVTGPEGAELSILMAREIARVHRTFWANLSINPPRHEPSVEIEVMRDRPDD